MPKSSSSFTEYGPAVGLTHENELRFAKEIIKNVPGIEMVRFVASGTEADMLAIRLARVYTGKQKLIKIGGNYHGWSDQLLISTNFPGTGADEAAGIPTGCYEHTIEVNQNDFEGLARAFEQNKGNVAAVLAEPTRWATPPLSSLILTGIRRCATFAIKMVPC